MPDQPTDVATVPRVDARRIVVFVYGAEGEELSRRVYGGSINRVRELDETLIALFRQWGGEWDGCP
jgi:hypothetical protein